MPKFILPDAPKGQFILNDRYVFNDGELQCSTADAEPLSRILCAYHACKLVYEDVVETPQDPIPDGSLKVETTKTEKAGKAEK